MIIVPRHGELDQVFHLLFVVGFGCLSRECVDVWAMMGSRCCLLRSGVVMWDDDATVI